VFGWRGITQGALYAIRKRNVTIGFQKALLPRNHQQNPHFRFKVLHSKHFFFHFFPHFFKKYFFMYSFCFYLFLYLFLFFMYYFYVFGFVVIFLRIFNEFLFF